MFNLLKLIKNTSIVGISTIITRIIGYAREIFLIAWMGTSSASDALIMATRIPTLLRKISTEGSLNGALIPLIDDLEKKNHKQTITNLINKIIIIFSIVFFLFFLFQTYYPEISLFLLAPGILKDQERLYWFTKYIPFTSLAILFFFLSGVFSAILNYNQKFFLPAIAPAFCNAFLVIFIICAQHYNLSFTLLGPAFLMATIVQCLVTFIPYLRLKIPFKIKKDKESKGILKVFFRHFAPVMFSASVSQINSIIVIILTSYLPQGNTTMLHRTERLLQIPIGFILALSTTLLPTLSKTHDWAESRKIIRSSLMIATLVFLPITIIFFLWPEVLVNLVFNYGKCTQNDICVMSSLLKIYSLGVPAFVLIRIMPIFFFARKEISVTTKGAVIHTVTSTIFSILFMQKFQAFGLAWAAIASSWIHVAWLGYNVVRKKYV